MPYGGDFFDKIFCISVLRFKWFEDILIALKEFNYVLKEGGVGALAFDYLIINLDFFEEIPKQNAFVFMRKRDKAPSIDVIYSEKWNAYCFRAVLKKIKNVLSKIWIN